MRIILLCPYAPCSCFFYPLYRSARWNFTQFYAIFCQHALPDRDSIFLNCALVQRGSEPCSKASQVQCQELMHCQVGSALLPHLLFRERHSKIRGRQPHGLQKYLTLRTQRLTSLKSTEHCKTKWRKKPALRQPGRAPPASPHSSHKLYDKFYIQQ